MKSASGSGPKSKAVTLLPNKKSNVLWWVLGIGGSLAAWLLFSSFKAAETALPGSNTGILLPPCGDDYNCSRGYWSWELLNTEQKRQDIALRASQGGKTVMQQAFDEAVQSMSGSMVNLSTYQGEVNAIIASIGGSASWLKAVQDKAVINKISLDQQLRDDAVWTLIFNLSDRAAKSTVSTSTAAVSGLGNSAINLL